MSVEIEVLVQDHKRAHHTDEGVEFHTVPGLLAQLRDAIYGGMANDGAGAGFRSKLPIQAAALDLYMTLDRQITEAWVEAFKRVPNADRIERLLSEWAAWAEPTTHTTVNGTNMYARDAVQTWITAVEDYFNPPRLAEIDAPCFLCGERYVHRTVDGETIRSAALTFRRDRDTGETLDAGCAGCGSVWLPSQFKYLAEQLSKSSVDTDRIPQ